MNKLLPIIFLSFFLTGCSFLPRITFDRQGTTPAETEQSYKRETCAGVFTLNPQGDIISCSKGYQLNEKNYSKKERKYTIYERIANFFSNLKGYLAIFLILSVIGVLMGAGGAVGVVWQNLFGVAGKGFKALVTGIQNGKNYVRENGTKYTDAERVIYNQGANDMLAKIAEATTDEKVRKEINLLRASL